MAGQNKELSGRVHVATFLNSSLWYVIGSITWDFWGVSQKGGGITSFSLFILAKGQETQAGMTEARTAILSHKVEAMC